MSADPILLERRAVLAISQEGGMLRERGKAGDGQVLLILISLDNTFLGLHELVSDASGHAVIRKPTSIPV